MDNQNNTTPEYNGPQKICKHCKKAIPKVSKTCPYCFQKQGMKTSTIVIIVIVVIALAAIFGNLGSSDTTDEKMIHRYRTRLTTYKTNSKTTNKANRKTLSKILKKKNRHSITNSPMLSI